MRDVVLWPTEGNYHRFRELCDDEVAATFEEFAKLANTRIQYIQNKMGITIDRISFDPDQMAQWCRAHFETVNAESRAADAAFLTFVD
jgi:hypothetical protein